MKVTYIDHMGSDLSVVNAARVSFAKTSDWVENDLPPEPGDLADGGWSEEGLRSIGWTDYSLSKKDTKLINYLARHNHWTPFGHTAVTLHVKAPIFVARQLGKHQVGLVWNEVSRRYVSDEPEVYVPDVWRKKADNVKQGSSDEAVESFRLLGFKRQTTHEAYQRLEEHSKCLYEDLIEAGVCPEQARMVLPQSMYTEWYWTGSIAAFSRVYNLRIDPHTQRETQEVAKQIGDVIEPLYPVSWKALTEG